MQQNPFDEVAIMAYIEEGQLQDARDELRKLYLLDPKRTLQMYQNKLSENLKWPPIQNLSSQDQKNIKFFTKFKALNQLRKAREHFTKLQKSNPQLGKEIAELHEFPNINIYSAHQNIKELDDDFEQLKALKMQDQILNEEYKYPKDSGKKASQENLLPQQEIDDDIAKQKRKKGNKNMFEEKKQFPRDQRIQAQSIYQYVDQKSINGQSKWDFIKIETERNIQQSLSHMKQYLSDMKKSGLKLDDFTYGLKDLIIRQAFQCIKCKQNFQKIIYFLDQKLQMQVTQRQLFSFILLNSKNELKQHIIGIASSYMPIPFLYSSNFETKNQVDSYYFVKELFGSIFKSNVILAISENQENIKCRISKVEIMNCIFQTNFDRSISKRGKVISSSLEIQFDYHYNQPQFLAFVLPCQKLSFKILQILMPLTKVLFIHRCVDEQNKNQDLVYKMKKLALSSKKKIIEFQLNDKSSLKQYKISQNQLNIIHPDIDNSQRKSVLYQRLHKYVLQFISPSLIIQDNIFKTRDSKQMSLTPSSFIKICNKFNVETKSLEFAEKYLKQLITYLMKFQNNFISSSLFPFTNYFKKECQTLQMYRKSTINTVKKDQLIDKIKKASLKTKIPEIIKLVKTISSNEYFVSILNLLAKQLLGYTSSHIKKIQQLSFQFNSKNISEDKLRKKQVQYDQQIKASSFSWKLVMRQLRCILKYQDNGQNRILLEEIMQKLNLEPFQIIQGECLSFSFPLEHLSNLFPQAYTQKTLVISIIGQQSSGKSTLLNYLLGTKYATSAGRCTKGTYGSIIPIEGNENFTQILLLDTQGIQSVQRKRNQNFDRCLCLFILSVSHICIINNEGNFRKSMKNTIQITLSCLATLQSFSIKPQIFFVLNKLSSVNQNQLADHIERLQDDLQVDQSVKQYINPKNFIFIPIGFLGTPVKLLNADPSNPVSANSTTAIFLIKIKQFLKRILSIAGQKNFKNLELQQWIKQSKTNWTMIRDHQGLVQYQDLSQKQTDSQIKQYIFQLKNQYLGQKAMNKFDKSVQKYIENFQSQQKLNPQVYDSISQATLLQHLKKDFREIQKQAYKKYDEYCSHRKIAGRVTYQRKNLLTQVFIGVLDEIQLNASQKITLINKRFNQASSSKNPFHKILQKLRILTFSNQAEIKKIFDQEWNGYYGKKDKEIVQQNELKWKNKYQVMQRFFQSSVNYYPINNTTSQFLIQAMEQSSQIKNFEYMLKQKPNLIYFEPKIYYGIERLKINDKNFRYLNYSSQYKDILIVKQNPEFHNFIQKLQSPARQGIYKRQENQARIILSEILDWKKVVTDLEIQIRTKLGNISYSDTQYMQLSKYIYESFKRNKQIPCQPSTEQTKIICKIVQYTAQKVNQDLKCFAFRLSIQGKALLYVFAMNLVWFMLKEYNKLRSLQQVKKRFGSYEENLKFFINTLISGNSQKKSKKKAIQME